MINQEEYMDIVSLARQGYSRRQIAQKTGLDRRTVGKYLKEQQAPAYKKVQRQSKLEPFYPLMEGWLAQQNFQATRIFELLLAEGFVGSYSIVKRHVRELKRELSRKAYIRFETLPGQQAQVDFGDFQVLNPNGSLSTVYAFVMVLGYSRHQYVEFIERCTLPLFLACHQNAFAFFGGVPCEIVYDNMKNVVIRRLLGKVQWNRAFEAFCLHYGMKPVAAAPYSPWVKGKVERPIGYIRERFWRGYSYQGIESANADIKRWIMSVAGERIHGTHRQKVSERFANERASLNALPEHPYDLSLVFTRKVYKDCQLSFDGNRYVVPHECVGRRVTLRAQDGRLRIFDNERLVAVYRIPQGKGHTLADPRFYRRLTNDREQLLRKYRWIPGKAKATRGLLGSELNVQVMHRPLICYAEAAL